MERTLRKTKSFYMFKTLKNDFDFLSSSPTLVPLR